MCVIKVYNYFGMIVSASAISFRGSENLNALYLENSTDRPLLFKVSPPPPRLGSPTSTSSPSIPAGATYPLARKYKSLSNSTGCSRSMRNCWFPMPRCISRKKRRGALLTSSGHALTNSAIKTSLFPSPVPPSRNSPKKRRKDPLSRRPTRPCMRWKAKRKRNKSQMATTVSA